MPEMDLEKYQLYYELHGDDKAEETVAFFNGVMTTTTSWTLYYPLFEKLNFRVLLHDFKGQLKSAKPAGPYTFKEHADDAKQLMDNLGIDKVHIISTSYGSQVALRFAVDYPDYVASLTIIDGTSEIDETTKLFVNGWKKLAQGGTGEDFFWGAVPSLYFNDFVKKNKAFLEERAKMLNEIDRDYFKGQIYLYDTFMNDSDITAELGKITCPCTIIYGENDILTPRKFSEILATRIRDAEFVIIPNCGHVTIFEQPEMVKSIVVGFILKNSLK
jgi:3-oxoadipate enol-lactonase